MLCAAGHVTAIAYIQGISMSEITADQCSKHGAVQKGGTQETSVRNVAADQEVM